MILLKKILSFFITISIIVLISTASFLWWNNHPPLSKLSNPPVKKINNIQNAEYNKNEIKVASYNIHFGIGLNRKTLAINQQSYIRRLNKITEILKEIDADVVLLQEVDFASKRSHFINQAEFLAENAGYAYFVEGTTLRKKFHLNSLNVHGKIDHGLAILSKIPIESCESYIFEYSSEMPFFLKWLFCPHGALKCRLSLNNQIIEIINLHIEPWSQETKENQIKLVKNRYLTNKNFPTIIGGDFNSMEPEILRNNHYHLNDAPYFIKKSKWDFDKEQTISIIKNLSFTEAVPSKIYLKNKTAYFTFPSNNPMVKLDYIFAGFKAKVKTGEIFQKARTASDHLPIYAVIKINEKSAGQNTANNH